MIHIYEDFCKGCSICIRFCNNGVLDLSDKVNQRGYFVPYVKNKANCKSCRRCEMFCPDFAIFTIEDEDENR